MLYIVTALKSEAQAFMDKYKLNKKKLSDFNLFYNDDITLIISGVGIDNSLMATQTLINHYDITDDDIYLNIGICGASTKYTIGELIEISELKYKDKVFCLNDNTKNKIECLDYEASTNIYEIVDMESFGFYDAVTHSPAIKNFHILKVVSDHFEPKKITKELTKSLIFNIIDDIKPILNTKALS